MFNLAARSNDLTEHVTFSSITSHASGAQAGLRLGLLKPDHDEGSEQEVGVKVLGGRDKTYNSVVRERLTKAFERWTHLDHPNLTPFLGAVTSLKPIPGIVTPYYDKGALWDYVTFYQPNGALTDEEISRSLRWALELSRAVEYLHTRNPPSVCSDRLKMPTDKTRQHCKHATKSGI
ncbi:hypothetical protein HGRIS_004956 [Hohenbuehelia grisea]|uniref:Protein kinase domain-containing protein n=1 Tax=Hohenbuehelia grisea TaxID=104357 RepID=A0ABR3JDR3_9AGAR